MKKYSKVLVEMEKEQYVNCNMCGKIIKRNDFGIFEDYLSIQKTWGYSSKYDSETHNIDLCENCYTKIIENLKIKPLPS